MDGSTRRTSNGPGRLLVLVYGIFALSAGARASVQIATKFADAREAYLLSAFAAVVYLLAAIGLARSSRRLATTSVLIELAGVLVVGTLSLLTPENFPDATVWSDYGQGYGYVPLVLPLLGLWWLWHTGRSRP